MVSRSSTPSSYGASSLDPLHGCAFQHYWMICRTVHNCAKMFPVCMIICILSLLATANDLLHCTHLCNFSSVWIVIWTLSVLAQPKDLLHWAHLWNFFAESASLWIFRLPEWSNVFLHWSHLQSFSPLLWVVTKFIRALVSVFGHKSPELVSAILKSEPCAQSGHQVLRMWCQHLHSVLSVHFPFHSREEENQTNKQTKSMMR